MKTLLHDKRFVTRFKKAARATLNWTATARILGIDRTTIYRWRELADQGEEPYASVMQAVYKEQFLRVTQAAKKIEKDPSWQAAAWTLERWDPAAFGVVPALRPTEDPTAGANSATARLRVLDEHWERTTPTMERADTDTDTDTEVDDG